MDFNPSARAANLLGRLETFMDDCIYASEPRYQQEMIDSGDPHFHPPLLEELKTEARRRGLWNLFWPHPSDSGEGVSNSEYAPLCEILGRSPLAAEACNSSAPDTGNMEILHHFGTTDQQDTWLTPLLEGTMRSSFAMTEPNVASSDATNIECRIDRDGGEYVINGTKWWITGAGRERCGFFIVMGKSDPTAPTYGQQSMVIVPRDTPGVTVVRSLPVLGYLDRESHCEVHFDDVRVPVGNLLGGEGQGFAIAQSRLGPGRIHHCMRTLGAAERSLELLCSRAVSRTAFGRPLSEQGTVQEWIANARIELDQARLYTMYAAWLIDTKGVQAARTEISGIKVAVPNAALRVIDHAIQVHGAGGLSDDFPMAMMYAHVRTLRIADGPDEVHRRAVAKRELRKYGEAAT